MAGNEWTTGQIGGALEFDSPGASDDIAIRFIAKGVYLDDRDNQKIRKAYFRSDSSYTEIQGSAEVCRYRHQIRIGEYLPR